MKVIMELEGEFKEVLEELRTALPNYRVFEFTDSAIMVLRTSVTEVLVGNYEGITEIRYVGADLKDLIELVLPVIRREVVSFRVYDTTCNCDCG